MAAITARASDASRTPRVDGDLKLVGLILLAGALEAILVERYPGSLPLWMPYEFSWGVFLSRAIGIVLYLRGLRRLPVATGANGWRKAAFLIGVGLIYASMQTWLDYAAQHMFFIHRLQHLFLHHTGPFLIALSNPDEAIWEGLPAGVRKKLQHRALVRIMGALQQPILASFLFVALIYIWPIPSIHFWAMLDPTLYTAMNWSVTIDGILFWSLILDPRPKPVARISYGTRFIAVIVVMFPQILLGACVVFAGRDIYPVYNICGRILPISGLQDQTYAGMILWIPSTMMSIIGALLVLNFMRLNEESEVLANRGLQ
ncbi:cytochrome c oxidase assembly protein [Rhizobium lusitanum]|uniref:Cytochrome c oxidase assembly protein n=1 Tax=Rhizobium lusitanum TaxID=293958 RepID=A0A6L9UHJ1_9HYPH|nr:cytochrome c oxidase assembly protein [Rhizobium lusitanum]NEI74839.1 cytochrome c oxidase assembly protein [Rhizobium lusitanum]